MASSSDAHPLAFDTSYVVLGVRHHGPGSARSLLAALDALQPDLVLIEGPPEADDLLPLAASSAMQPPVALLVYAPEEPRRTAVFPFAEYSPEWQALQYALRQEIPVRFMDLPQRNWLAMRKPDVEAESHEENGASAVSRFSQVDPLDLLAQVAGFADGERWWEQVIEERGGDAEVFPAILEALREVRSKMYELDPTPRDPLEPVREAAMRMHIRDAQKAGFVRLAVVCGAWHAPALVDMPTQTSDQALLRGLPRVKVAVTWVPWSYLHLTYASGYGAGVVSPGWYEHVWRVPEQTSTYWLARVASLLRGEDLDASSAQVIDAVRLAEALAALRGRARPGLQELNAAAQTVFCFGDALPLRLVRQRLIVAERLGEVPSDSPTVPLLADVEATQRRLRLKPSTERQVKDLDLRKATDLARSALLHRLNLLGIAWGTLRRARGGLGTFHEVWILQWDPAFTVALVAAARWGNTLSEAAAAYTQRLSEHATNLGKLTHLLDQALLADLPVVIPALITQLQAKAALSGDVLELMQGVPPLARALRYGTVRDMSGTASVDPADFAVVLNGMVTRICIALPLACASLDDDAAQTMLKHIEDMQQSLSMLENEGWIAAWQAVLRKLADQEGLHGLIAGRVCRLLLDAGLIGHDDVARRLHLALSPGTEPLRAAYWLEGFLRGSALLLLHDDALWDILDAWVTSLSAEDFVSALPLLRRAFSEFPAPERRQMGERVARGQRKRAQGVGWPVDEARADAALPLLAQILGLDV